MSNPNYALNNADNHETFAENTPPLSMGPINTPVHLIAFVLPGKLGACNCSSAIDMMRRLTILKLMLNYLGVDRVFHAFGDPTRRQMLEQLSRGPATVSSLAEPLGITLAAVVQQLQILENSGVVSTQKIGRVRTCRLEPAGFTLAAEWIDQRRALWERRLDRLGDLLAEGESRKRNPPRK